MKTFKFLKLLAVFLLILSFNSFGKEVISNKNITINLAKDILKDMKHSNSKKEYKLLDNSWRYQIHKERTFVNSTQSQMDIQIPLIWYYERF